MILLADTQERRAAVAGRSLARVGIFEGSGEIAAAGVATDGRYDALNADMMSFFRGRWGTGIFFISSSVGKDGDGLPIDEIYGFDRSYPVSAEKKTQFNSDASFYDSWAADYKAWKVQWRDIRKSTPGPTEKTKIDKYETIVEAWQKKARDYGVGNTITPKEDTGIIPGLGGAKDAASGIFDTLERLVWIGGILVIGYFGFVYILPAFLGAGATARSARRSYQEA